MEEGVLTELSTRKTVNPPLFPVKEKRGVFSIFFRARAYIERARKKVEKGFDMVNPPVYFLPMDNSSRQILRALNNLTRAASSSLNLNRAQYAAAAAEIQAGNIESALEIMESLRGDSLAIIVSVDLEEALA